MKQFYSALLSVIPNSFARDKLFLLVFNYEFGGCGLFVRRFKYLSVLASFMAATFFSGISYCSAQDKAKQEPQSIAQIAGKWILSDANVMIEQRKVTYFTKEESFWSDHINDKIPLVITKDGSVTYSMDWQPAYARVKIKNGDLVFIFSGEADLKSDGRTKTEIKEAEDVNAANFTIYKFRIEGDQLIISRRDPRVEEEYIFNRQ